MRYFVRTGVPFEVPPFLRNLTASGTTHTAELGNLFFVKTNEDNRLDDSLIWIYMVIALSLEPPSAQWVHVESFQRDYSVQHVHPVLGLCLNFTPKKGEPTWIKANTFGGYRAAYLKKEKHGRDEHNDIDVDDTKLT